MNPKGPSNSKKKKKLSKISDFSSAKLGSGTDGAILLIAKLARLGETKDVFEHVKTKFTNVLPTDLSQFRGKNTLKMSSSKQGKQKSNKDQ